MDYVVLYKAGRICGGVLWSIQHHCFLGSSQYEVLYSNLVFLALPFSYFPQVNVHLLHTVPGAAHSMNCEDKLIARLISHHRFKQKRHLPFKASTD